MPALLRRTLAGNGAASIDAVDDGSARCASVGHARGWHNVQRPRVLGSRSRSLGRKAPTRTVCAQWHTMRLPLPGDQGLAHASLSSCVMRLSCTCLALLSQLRAVCPSRTRCSCQRHPRARLLKPSSIGTVAFCLRRPDVLRLPEAAVGAVGRYMLLQLPRAAGQPGGAAVARLLLHAAGGLPQPGALLLAADALLRQLLARGLDWVCPCCAPAAQPSLPSALFLTVMQTSQACARWPAMRCLTAD